MNTVLTQNIIDALLNSSIENVTNLLIENDVRERYSHVIGVKIEKRNISKAYEGVYDFVTYDFKYPITIATVECFSDGTYVVSIHEHNEKIFEYIKHIIKSNSKIDNDFKYHDTPHSFSIDNVHYQDISMIKTCMDFYATLVNLVEGMFNSYVELNRFDDGQIKITNKKYLNKLYQSFMNNKTPGMMTSPRISKSYWYDIKNM